LKSGEISGALAEAVPGYGIMGTMADEKSELLKKPTINIRNPADVELWTATLNIYTAQLVRAVSEVGDSSEKVLAYLMAHGTQRRDKNPN
jgi:hypothetical protein